MADLTAFTDALAQHHLAVKHMAAWADEHDARAMAETEILLLAEEYGVEVTEVRWWETVSEDHITYNIGVRLAPKMVSVEVTIRETV